VINNKEKESLFN
jgi:hypothetical protein